MNNTVWLTIGIAVAVIGLFVVLAASERAHYKKIWSQNTTHATRICEPRGGVEVLRHHAGCGWGCRQTVVVCADGHKVEF